MKREIVDGRLTRRLRFHLCIDFLYPIPVLAARFRYAGSRHLHVETMHNVYL
jgi:hypothetical protein